MNNFPSNSSSFWVVLGQSFSLIGLLVSIKLITQYVDPYDFGIFSLYLSIIIFVKNLSVQPFLAYVLRFVPEGNDPSNEIEKINYIIKTPIIYFVLFGLMLLGLGFTLKINFIIIVSLILLSIISDSLRDYFRSQENALKNFKKMAFFLILPSYLKAIIGVIIYKNNPGFQSLLVGFILSNIITIFSFGLTNIYGMLHAKKHNNFEYENFKSFYLPLVPHKLSSWFFSYIDKYMILFFLGPTVVGLYTPIYNLVYQIYWFIHETLTLRFRPYFYEQLSQNKIGDAIKTVVGQFKIALFFYILVFILLLSPFFLSVVRIFISQEYLELIYIVPALGLALTLQMLGLMFEMFFYGLKKTFVVFKIQFFSSLILLIVAPFAINYFAINGLVISLIFGYSLYIIVSLIILRRLIG